MNCWLGSLLPGGLLVGGGRWSLNPSMFTSSLEFLKREDNPLSSHIWKGDLNVV
jgi:hypothetical protein